MIETTAGREFPLREAHSLVRDLMTPNPWIYWVDFLFHISLGWAAFLAVLSMPLFSAWQLPAFYCRYTCVLSCSYFHSRTGPPENGNIRAIPSGVERHLRHTVADSLFYL